jgi:Photosynthesis system II assembly factor YCF48/Putative zinc-finger
MEPLPKLVRQRLQAAAQAGVHPDPDLLAGFAERSLSERERAPVLEHLANCADCRQIVSLSLPPFELQHADAAGAVLPSRIGWGRRPGLRWAAAAACLAVVGGAVILGRHALATKETIVALHQTQSQPMPNEYSQQPQATDQANQIVARVEPPPPRRGSARSAGFAGKSRALDNLQKQTAKTSGGSGFGMATIESRRRESGAAPAIAAKGALSQADKKLPTTGQQLEGLRTSQGQMSETVQVESAAPTVSTEQVEVYPRTEAKDFPLPAPRPGPATPNGSGSPKGIVGGAVISRNQTVQIQAAGDSIMPRWTLSSDGTLLLRSFDNGKTWQSVPVAGGLVFRALSALGPEVWIGGSAGALYHSSDSGQHWQKVEPSAGGRILVADILALEFTDPLHGKLTTANHEIWITADAGQSWQLR